MVILRLLRLSGHVCLLLLLSHSLAAQEIRRALPVNEPPTAPAVPFEGEPANLPPPSTPRPRATATPERPAATPVPVVPAEPVAPPAPPQAALQTPEQQQLELANGLYARKMYDMAAPEYEKYLGMFANAAERQTALFRLGESYREMGNLNAARNSYEMLLSGFNNGEFIGPAAFRLGEMYFQDKNYSGALQMYRRASVRVKDPAVVIAAKFNVARCLDRLEQSVEARAAYEEVVNMKGDNPFKEGSRLALAQIYSQIGRKPDALKQLQAIANETSNAELKAEASVKAGLLQIDLGQHDKAAAELKKALKLPEIGKWKEVAQVGLLRMLYEGGKYKQLVDNFDPDSKDFSAETRPEVLLLAANSHRQLGNSKAAQELFEKVIAEFPNTAYAREAQYNRIVSLYSSDDPNLIKEVDDYLSKTEDQERRDQITLLKAEALYKKQDWESAAAVYESIKETRLTPAYKAEALFKMGWCHMQLKRYDQAIKTFTEFIAEYPSNKLVPSALAQRALANQQAKSFEGALKDFNQIITKYPKAKEREVALQQKALILGQQQDNKGMAESFRLLLKEYPKTPAAAQANYWIGWTAFEGKNYKEAIEPLSNARELDDEQFFERATLRIMLSRYYLEEKAELAREIDAYTKKGKSKVPIEVLRWLAGQYYVDKNFEGAAKYYDQLTKREEAVSDDWLNLGRSYVYQDQFTKALEPLEQYLKSVKEPAPRAVGLLAQGKAQLGLGKFEEAQKSADEACSLQPEGKTNAEGRLLSGDIAMAQGNPESAGKIFSSVAVLVDDPVLTPQALEKAYGAYKKAGDDPQAAKTLNELQTRYPEYQLKS